MSSLDPILLIDDDEQLSEVICLLLESEGFDIRACSDPQAALGLVVREEFSAILLDIRLGEYNGIDLLKRIRETDPDIPVFMITAHGEIDTAVESFTVGANGYIRKPFQEGELKSQVLQAVEKYKLKRALHANRVAASSDEIRGLFLTRDPIMEPLLRNMEVAARVASNVVITGETGSGKEVVAQALHRTGVRKNGPFIAFNCAAVPATLIESELFGHVRGAFTDARENKPGLFVRADRGTLFLDEIGEASPAIQSKLLRVLQEKEVLPLGATSSVAVDVRIVAATHRNLEREVAEGRFREDLFYRLHVIPLEVLPLRKRPKDIPYLASIFAQKSCEQLGGKFEGFTASAWRALAEHQWPGNVRELQNRMERAAVLGMGSRLTAAAIFPEKAPELPEYQDAHESQGLPADAGELYFETAVDLPALPLELPTFGEAKISFEKTYLERVLSAAKGNIAKAARLASKSRTEVYGLIRKHQLDPGKFR
jgi:two-component system response regulator GlrR